MFHSGKTSKQNGLWYFCLQQACLQKIYFSELPRALDFMYHEARNELPDILLQYKIRNYILVGYYDGASITLIHESENTAEGLLGIVNEAPQVFFEQLNKESI